jgi:hypothetical protein
MDRLEHELRDVLTHERRALSTDLVDLDRVYARAAVRRRRRTAVTAAAAAAVLAAVAVPVSLTLLDSSRARSPIEAAVAASPTVASTPNVSTPSPSATSPVSPTPASSATPSAIRGAAWSGARVSSVTATSTRTILVLGFLGDTRGCTPPDCLRLVQSRDGGRTFTSLPVPAEALAGDAGKAPAPTATDVRFGSATDGWLFGTGLWATHDGARTWRPVDLPGAVSRLAAAHGVVWALVTAADGNSQQLWRSPVGSDSWTRVPGVTVGAPGDVALAGANVVVLGTGPSKMWVSRDGTTFAPHANPCSTAVKAELSASTSLWAKCETGTAAYVITSADGVSWQPVKATPDGSAAPNSLALGARGPTDALLALGANEKLTDLNSDGTQQPVRQPPAASSGIRYLGFTTVDVGYAIDGVHLWRTEDGGNTWNRLHIG